MLTRSRLAVPLLLASLATVAVAGCSSNTASPSASSATPTSASPTSAGPTSASPTNGDLCNLSTISAAVPSGSTVMVFKCATAGDEFWAAGTAKSSSGSKPFFLKANDGSWSVVNADEVCGTASAGLPPAILSYCNTKM